MSELQLELPLEEDSNVIELVVPKEVPMYKFKHPYGTITIYLPTGEILGPEKVYLLLEQAKHDLLASHLIAVKDVK